jgi:hypothetical protein
MTELLAPNGKPSNLSAEQYKLVRLPEFKAWFGDWETSPETASKVVDSNGEPLPVYHGTNAEPFVVFDGGSFFTDDYMNADGYASGEMVYEVFLNIKTPFSSLHSHIALSLISLSLFLSSISPIKQGPVT